MEQNDIRKSAEVLSMAMQNNLPGIVFLAKKNGNVIGVMRMESCTGNGIEGKERFDVTREAQAVIYR